jgi:drug/metabolite transporter superfamily protein YnfA
MGFTRSEDGLITGIADIVLIPGALALYLALRKVHKTAMLIATGILLAYVAIDISTFVSTSTTIMILTQNYAATTNVTQQAAILGAEYYGLATIPLSQFLGWFFPSFGYLIVALTIRSGHLGKVTAILGILASVFDIVGSFAFWYPGSYVESFLTPGLALLGLFALSAGIMLFRLGRTKSQVTRLLDT